jgi:hypothetical protein
MAGRKRKVRIYTVVDVMAGVAVGVRAFPRRRAADRYAVSIKKSRDLGLDDVQVFEAFVEATGLRSASSALNRRV